ncbi:MAG: SDR family NAD(P)-dependent oxidoreductase, partial [Ignavibacterium sp.]
MKKIIITGATGLIGRKLSQKLFEAGHQIIIFSRDASSAKKALKKEFTYIDWDYRKNDNWLESISSADAIVHLAGINLFSKRWNKKFKEEILASRKETT